METLQYSVFDDLAEFLASLSPEKVLAYQPSDKKQKRLGELLAKKQMTELTDAEAEELKHFFTLERIIRMAKTHALTLLTHEPVHS